MPISFSYIDCIIPADRISYESFTDCKDPKDDPILFVHGADADRIVGFNDDAPYDICKFFDISRWNSYLAQEYKIKTSGISVSNYSSSNPESTCTITTYSPQTIPIAEKMKRTDSQSRTENLSNSQYLEANIQVNISGLEKSLKICSPMDISRITVYDFSGNKICSKDINSYQHSVFLSSINMNTPGMYIVCFETSEGIVSKKILIK